MRAVVAFAPGGVTDTFARFMAQKLTEQLGKQVYVENIAGASGNIRSRTGGPVLTGIAGAPRRGAGGQLDVVQRQGRAGRVKDAATPGVVAGARANSIEKEDIVTESEIA